MEEKYYHSKESVEEYIRLAKDVSGNDLIEKLKKILPQDSSVLEIGSGPGTDWEILSKTYETTGSDNSTVFLDHLSKRHPKGDFVLLDAVTLETELTFDGIYSNKVMHHLKTEELQESIKRQYSLLNPNGIVCHSFWKGDGDEYFKGMYVNYHTGEQIKSYFESAFEVLVVEAYKEFDEDDSILLIAKKK